MKFPCRLIILTALIYTHAACADLEGDIRKVLGDKALQKAEVGIQIVRLGADDKADTVIFRHNSDIPLIPASNLKLVTTSAALARLGPDFKFRTLLLKHGTDLVLIGDGDPSLGDAELYKKVNWQIDTVFKNWGAGLKKHELTTFERLIVDDSVFDEDFLHWNWPIDQSQRWYAAQVGGLNLNINCANFFLRLTSAGETVEWRTEPATKYIKVSNACISGGQHAVWLSRELGTNQIILKGRAAGSNTEPLQVTIHDPSLFTATVMRETFESAGVKIANAPVRDRTLRAKLLKEGVGSDPAWQVLAIHETPLSTALMRANKDSINMYAEALCKRVGAEATGQSGSWKNGLAATAEHLKSMSINEAEFKLDDGCGLSKENTISANALCRVLSWNFHAKTKDTYISSLSVAGKDGTLDHRFAGSDLRGRVFGKSGYVNSVRTLSGYLKAKDDNWYAFSILINQIPDTATGKNLQETIVQAIDVNSRELTAAGQ